MSSFVRTSARAIPAGIAMLLLAGSAAAQWPPWTREESEAVAYPEVLVERSALPGLVGVLLDARSPAAYGRGHLPGALSLPPDSLLAEAGLDRRTLRPEDPALARELPRVLGALGLSGREKTVVYGDREEPEGPAQLLWCLELAGHSGVQILDGGVVPGEPGFETAAPRLPPTTWEPSAVSTCLATPEWVLARYGRPHPGIPDWELLDLRGEHTWQGRSGVREHSPGGGRGHVPQSHPVECAALFRTDGRWVPADSLRAYLEGLGPRPATTLRVEAELVVYGDGVGGAGALGYVAARIAGFSRVRWLAGGWGAWLAAAGPRTRVLDSAGVAALTAAAAEQTRELVLLDVRHRADWSAGHLPGAVQLAPHDFADSLDVVLRRHWGPDLDRAGTTLVAYCYGPGCVRSRNCTTLAAQAGFRDLVWFRGGLESWVAAGGEIVREKTQNSSWWIPRPDEEARPESDSRAGSGRRELLPDSTGTVP